VDFLASGLMLIAIKPEYSPINLLGKLFFRRAASWEQRHKMINPLWAAAFGLVLGAISVSFILLENSRH
jgi:hypothetical protein